MKRIAKKLGSLIVALSIVVMALPVVASAAPANAIPSVSSVSVDEDWIATVKTDGSNLNIRSGPGTNYSIVGKFANGTKVHYGAIDPIGSLNWTYVWGTGINGKEVTGYVHNDYLS